MADPKHEIDSDQIRNVTILAIIVNFILCSIKVIVGLLAGSLSLVSDGFHSLSDMSTDIMVLVGVHLGSKQPDKKHPYGHGRLETMVTLIIAVALLFVGIGTIYYAVIDITKGHIRIPHLPVLIVAILALIAKETLSRITIKIAIKTHSAALYANAWEQRSDAFSSLAVIIGYFAMKFGFHHGDQIATIFIGTMIIMVGAKVLIGCINELTECAVDSETIEQVQKIISSHSSIKGWHDLRSHTVGREVFLDLHILVDPDLDITTAHEISENLEKTLQEQMARPINIIIHIEPNIPSFKK